MRSQDEAIEIECPTCGALCLHTDGDYEAISRDHVTDSSSYQRGFAYGVSWLAAGLVPALQALIKRIERAKARTERPLEARSKR